jgi:predicted DNA-binding transcriptional regulator AlpA
MGEKLLMHGGQMTDDNKPRLIGRREAAAYCGIAESTFSLWVATHKMPQSIPGTRKWDKRAIDARLDEISGLVAPTPAEMPQRPTRDEFVEWEKEEKRRDQLRPRLGLDAKLERILVFMSEHPESETIDEIPQAGPVLIERLTATGAISIIRRGPNARYVVSDIGHAEVARISKWRAKNVG